MRIVPIAGAGRESSASRLEAHFRASEARATVTEELRWRVVGHIARRLHDSIRRLLKDGVTEPLFIASEALKDVEKSEPGTP
jgi:hypothetical protein